MCVGNGRVEKCLKYLIGRPEERDHLEESGVDRKVITEWILKRSGKMVCRAFYLAHNDAQMQAVVNKIITLCSEKKKRGEFLQ
jgi:hypothetical protein